MALTARPAGAAFPAAARITEVCPRDGFQNAGEWIPTETKLRIIDALAACGFPAIEATSFVSPAAVPQMADAAEVLAAATARHPGVEFPVLVPNARGAADALAAGARSLVYVVSASERHSLENSRRTVAQALAGLAEAARERGAARLRLSVATAFDCPWTGPVPAETVLGIVERGLELGVDGVCLADTMGDADPPRVAALLEAVRARFPGLRLALHLHDSRGRALANARAAMELGVDSFESALGGLGGCPFAPGAPGNVATEDLVGMLEGLGIRTGIDRGRLREAASLAASLLPGRPRRGCAR